MAKGKARTTQASVRAGNVGFNNAASLRMLEQEKEALENDKDALEDQNKKLQEELKLYKAKSTPKTLSKLPVNVEMKRKIKATVKRDIYRFVKFVDGPKQKDKIARKVFKLLHLEKTHEGFEDSWVATYASLVCTELNLRRSYSQSEMKKTVQNYCNANGVDSLPTVEQILACATRKTEDMELFEWYWDKLLPNVVGTILFGTNVRHYKTISAAMTKDCPRKRVVEPSSEAFVVLLFENCRSKWVNMVKYYDANPSEKGKKNGTQFRKKKKRNTEGAEDDDPEGAEYATLYTDQDIGQCEFGGWSRAGLRRFTYLTKEIKASHEEMGAENLQAKEKSCLDRIRTRLKLVCDDYESERRSKRKRRKNDGAEDAEQSEEEIETFVLSSSDDDE
jgi:hypothetical protein